MVVKGKVFLMRIFVITITLSSLLILSACGGLKIAQDAPRPIDSKPVLITKQGSVSDTFTSDNMFTRKRSSNKPIITSKPMFTVKNSRGKRNRKRFQWFEDYKKNLPAGYRGMPKGKILKPPKDDTVLITSQGDWDSIRVNDYPPEEEKIYEPIEYPDLTVYPIDGDVEPYTSVDKKVPVDAYKQYEPKQGEFLYVDNVANIPGEVAEDIFFNHASSKISKIGVNKLYDLSSDIADLGGGVRVSVVGHASNRVYNVSDPALKRRINQKMSEFRARAVSKRLKKMGINSNMLIVKADGADVPNPAPGRRTQEASDRRVDIYLY